MEGGGGQAERDASSIPSNPDEPLPGGRDFAEGTAYLSDTSQQALHQDPGGTHVERAYFTVLDKTCLSFVTI